MFDYEFTAPQGWICPKCGRVYSPTTFMCYYCGGEKDKITYTTDTSNCFKSKVKNFIFCKDCIYNGTSSIDCPQHSYTSNFALGCYEGVLDREKEEEKRKIKEELDKVSWSNSSYTSECSDFSDRDKEDLECSIY